MKQHYSIKIFIFCAIGVCINVVLGSIITVTNIPFLFLDAIGTIFIAVNFRMRDGIHTGVCTNLLLGVIHGPLALPFGFVSITIAIVANLCARKSFSYKKAFITGILLVLVGSLVSAPIRVILYGGFGGLSKSVSDILVFSLQASGRRAIVAAYWGAVTDGIVDKIISCFIVVWLSNLPQIQPFLQSFRNSKENYHEWSKENS
ncbi:hypothetical protein P7D85_22025 [Enterococcus hulanensis]|uniref:ECF transporter S component n=1 Tax=Enterococcus hulanensis TaxID=2559929 RepID=A0ABU3F5N2_9ENTE|nr:hypothetical protein [Enterococcus hulanensis]MDT2602449.1 hypothetical protein [Enterococcus hulanensis]MDT2611844.1 hypothetical protein [Enterococcus hulanensis]MDT2619082.1 hypothetical protein [Enterococcus hulanensis]MDT2630521.1 hypothetical protein [Enterococcus hulanensis]MDT2658071.1 hypothetical protein [Enterococcus hulanensis]